MSDRLPNTSSEPSPPVGKILYIDHLKVLLTGLVVLHHACVTYGGPGSWYYSEKTLKTGVIIPVTMLVATNQAFFMGFFFFLSAIFIPASLTKKGTGVFIKDRLKRLGIPLLFYSFILSPVMNYLVYYFAGGHHITFFQFLSGYDSWVSFGVMWFVVALLLFTAVYILWKEVDNSKPVKIKSPSVSAILIFAGGLGLLSFFVRIVFPVGWVLNPFGFQLGHFPQYIALFFWGIVCYNSNWLNEIDSRFKKSGRIKFFLIVFGFPVIFAIRVLFDAPVAWYSGGAHFQSLVYALWEQLTGFTIITWLLYIGKNNWNKPSPFLAKLARCAFAVYIFHPFVLICLSLLLKDWPVDPALKLLFVAPFGILFSFLLGHLIIQIPGVKKFL
ncbi:acyltransferase family protein [Dyadobacter subterraneus]|uniref:Acyltransferase n=1 Tax=Dyadobacter subterraneus TaxID=2773304 RepID=A0ABR9WDI7_9BACT|nr:acyltransferase [Dyadobacter subterraneus]MBE9463473.1 acyltransferase [Dyadobacter subterraneus]